MKLKLVLVLAGLVMAIAVLATPASIVVTSSKESVFNVQYKASQAGKVTVSIINDKNEVVFVESINNIASFTRPYNFSELSEGEYTIVVEGNGTKQAEKVKYETAKIISFAMVSEVENQKNKYLLNVTNNGIQNVTVRIFSNEGTLLHEQSMEVKESAALIYDLNQVKKDNATITFEIIAGGNTLQTIHI